MTRPQQVPLGQGPVYYGKAFTCGTCGRRFRSRASSKNGKGWATQGAERNRDRHQAACGGPTPKQRQAHEKAQAALRREAAGPHLEEWT